MCSHILIIFAHAFVHSKSLHLWQLTNGVAFIQMIYSKDDELIDCEYVRQKSFVRDFLSKFHGEIAVARARNFTAPAPRRRHHHRHHADEDVALTDALQDFRALTLGSEAQEEVADNGMRRLYDSAEQADDEAAEDAFGMRTLQYRQLHGASDVPDDMVPLLRYGQLKRQCDERHQQMKRIVHDMASGEADRREAATEHLER